jgi:hypothetical protein
MTHTIEFSSRFEPSRVPDAEQESSREVLEHATEQMLTLFCRHIAPVFDGRYVIFASTGLYLHGKKHHDYALMQPPGDLDVVVFDRALLDRLLERLQRIPGVVIDGDGIRRPFHGQETQMVSGHVRMRVDDIEIEYPFEFFTIRKLYRPPCTVIVMLWQMDCTC